MTRRIGTLLLACSLFLTAASGQAPKETPAPKTTMKSWQVQLTGLPKLDDTIHYLPRVVKVREMMKAAGDEAASGLNQALAAEAAFVGRYREAMALMDMGRPETPPAKNTDALDPYEPKDAAEAILAMADGRQVVMINEAHHV